MFSLRKIHSKSSVGPSPSWFSESQFVGSRTFAGTVDSLRPNDVIWRHRGGSALAQVMACHLAASRHYLSQCWLSLRITRSSIPNISLTITHLKFYHNLLRAKDTVWVPRPGSWRVDCPFYIQPSQNSTVIRKMKHFILWCSDYDPKSPYWCTIHFASIMMPWFGILCTWWHWLLWRGMATGHAIST